MKAQWQLDQLLIDSGWEGLKEKEILELNDLILEKKQNIKLIKAELAYLSRPERLQSIAEKQFNMKEILPSDIWNINDISKLYFEKN